MPNSLELDAAAIAQLTLRYSDSAQAQVARIQARIDLVVFWDIQAGQCVLEIGCGQGECTAVLASAVGETGSVTALDPAPPEYGTKTCP
jgi:predicted methyltransferase